MKWCGLRVFVRRIEKRQIWSNAIGAGKCVSEGKTGFFPRGFFSQEITQGGVAVFRPLRNRNEITRANLPGLEERASVAAPVIYSQSGKLPRQLLGSLFNPGASSHCLFPYGS
jgi:hypothetical protein